MEVGPTQRHHSQLSQKTHCSRLHTQTQETEVTRRPDVAMRSSPRVGSLDGAAVSAAC